MNMTPAETIIHNGLETTRDYINQKIEDSSTFFQDDFILQRIIESHDIINKRSGLKNCIDLIQSVESCESEYGSRLGTEYKKSSENPNDMALMLCDDGRWISCLHSNAELDDSKFLNINRIKQAIVDMESCQPTANV